MSGVPEFFSEYQRRVDEELRRLVPADGSRVQQAMAYTVHAPSKRVRAVLTLLCAELCGGSASRAAAAAAAVELVHASSLILDDLPAMDDAPLRRGRPANHVEFGEAIAMLAAFGLLNLAFGALSRAYDAPLSATLSTLLSEAVGLDGLIGGQAEDLLAADQRVSFEILERIHRGKTGALFVASAAAGALTAGAGPDQRQWLGAFAKNLGLAFQIIDDLLDVEGNPEETGKAVRARPQEDDVRIVQRRRRCAPARRRVVPDRRSGPDAVREARGSAAGPVGIRRGPARMTETTPVDRDAEVDALRERLRALGYLDAGVDRFVLAPAHSARGSAAIALLASLRIGVLGGLLLGPAAAIGLALQLPALITSVRDAAVIAVYMAVLFGAGIAAAALVADRWWRSSPGARAPRSPGADGPSRRSPGER